jgi:hypothetical protein
MSTATGAMARVVIEAADTSTKRRTAVKSPTPRATPITGLSARRGSRRRSRRL